MSRGMRVGIALGWAAAVIAGVRGVDLLLDLHRRQSEELDRRKERWMRLQGWVEAEEKVSARRKEVLGRFAAADGKDAGWVVLQGLQETAQGQGLSITDLRPSQVKGQGKRKASFRVDAKLEGEIAQVDKLLQELPKSLPGVRLENFQLVPLEGGKVQSVLRVEWSA